MRSGLTLSRAVEAYNQIKNKLLAINRDVGHIIQGALSIDGLSPHPINAWKETTARIERQLAEETIRVAVVGSIKSGKSTLTNALFGGDYVKRGAGVVTSIITKLRPGHNLTAKLAFKTWDEINAEINQALILFSSTPADGPGDNFNINREEDRRQLQQDVSKMNTEQLISDDTRDPNSVLLTEYLKGYDRVKALVSFEPAIHIFESKDFHKQKDFVGDESLAVYLKDVQLTLEAPEGFGENLEIADCQGSDSPNPLHLAMIQDYLIQTHLIIYVLSSRTGVRQADIKFLTLIKKMGLAKNILFVLNSDLSEHETLADLTALARRVEEEVDMIFPSPRVFVFSALYNLFKTLDSREPATLSRKDRLRLEQWRQETDIVAFSDQQTERFLKAAIQKISLDRFSLLLETNLERIANVSSSMRDWVQINQELLLKDAGKAREVFVEMDARREASEQVTAVIKDTLEGTTGKLKRDLGTDVDRFFDLQYGDIVQDMIHFIDSYNLSVTDYEKDLGASGFLPTLYRIFQAFQQAANRFIAESINPKLVNFVRDQENRTEGVFDQVSGPYSLMIKDAVDQHRRTVNDLGINIPEHPFRAIRSPGVASVRNDARLSIPHLTSTLRYSSRIKTEAILRLGFYNTLKTVKKWLKRPVSEGPDSAIRSLENSVHLIKEQMRESITAHFMDYKENLKYQYFFKLIEAMSARLYEALIDRVRAFTGSLLDMKGLIEDERVAKDQLVQQFASMQTSLKVALDHIGEVERLVESRSAS
jgi:GTPase SAR1 family protein